MIVLDEPYVSEPLIAWLEESQHPVLDNAFARSIADGRALNLVSSDEAVRRIDAGERVYTNSENALAWIVESAHNESLSRAIGLFKDKAAMRAALAGLDPDLFFKSCSVDELFKLDFSQLPAPFVLKPSVGFCSMGVYAIQNREDWERALADIQQNASSWHDMYPESVIGAGSFILEGYLEGTEYALDAYFDEDGAPHILNILRHDFAGPEDTSDRMYLTDGAIVDAWNDRFTAWLAAVNKVVGARSIPVHVELRVDGDTIAPIEFNPLRFAGLGGTDVAFYGVGLRTYEAFLEDTPVDLEALYAAHPGKVYSMSLLNPAPEADLARPFDGAALCERFSHVLAYHGFDPVTVGFYGFLFLETDAEGTGADERDWLLRSDLMEFVGGAL